MSNNPIIDEDELFRDMQFSETEDVRDVAVHESERTSLEALLTAASATHNAGLPMVHSSATTISDLEKNARDLRVASKMVEHNLQLLLAAEASRDAAYRSFGEAENELEASARALSEALISRRESGSTKDLEALFDNNAAALDRLEQAAGELKFTHAWCRSACLSHIESSRVEEDLRVATRRAGQAA